MAGLPGEGLVGGTPLLAMVAALTHGGVREERRKE